MVDELIPDPSDRWCQNPRFWKNVHAGILKKSVEASSAKITVFLLFSAVFGCFGDTFESFWFSGGPWGLWIRKSDGLLGKQLNTDPLLN